MKKISAVIITLCLFILIFCGCKNTKQADPAALRPDTAKLQAICNLATLECYFHNVAKSETQGIWNLNPTKKTFWVEYTGTVKIGIDVSQVKCEIDGNRVSITIPKAKVLSIGLDDATYNEDSFYAEKNTILNGKISAEEQTAAVHEAQTQMRISAESNESIMLAAQDRAKEMIENYFKQLGDFSEKEYSITWIELEEKQEPEIQE